MNQKNWETCLLMPMLLWSLSSSTHAQVMQEREVVMGVQQHLDFPQGIQRIAIADDAVVNVAVERVQGDGNPARLLLTPLKPGSTSLMVWGIKEDKPRSWLLNVKPSVQIRRTKYEELTEMALQEAALKPAAGATNAAINASEVVHGVVA